MFVLRVELAGPPFLQIVVLLQRLELLLQDCCRVHRRQDRSDAAVDFEGCRLVAGCLTDHHLLDELAHEVDEGLLRLGIGVLAHVIEGRVDDQLDGLRTDLRLQLPNLLPEIFRL
ncbi:MULTISPECIES: hypothetical protein [Agrobacterium]|uniref:hypothetical protein n=1 Tax=Agrobacterium TaxID=357 RepID=UPI002300069A|nr:MULTISPECIES: hypothetical protein [Agrobacterium]MDA5641568.1 hypothetical protein [Agrobacterium sp. ST15.13.013]MDA7001775.1 hypothetical protein [Agrobacterium salinitolerans]